MSRTFHLIPGLILALCAGPAWAEKVYKCLDEKGNVSYVHSYNPTKCKGGGSQLNSQGLSIRQMKRQKTPEELAVEAEQRKKEAALAAIKAAQDVQDRALLGSYNGVEDLIRARDGEVEVVKGSITTTNLTLASQDKALGEILAHAAAFERAKKPVPEETAKQLEAVRKQLDETRNVIKGFDLEIEKINKNYEAKIKRFNELKAKEAAHRSGSPAAG
jgi:hypothetical protein